MLRLSINLLSREETLFFVQTAPKHRKDFGYPIAALFVVAFLLMFYVGQLSTIINLFWGILVIQVCVVLLPSLGLLRWLRQPIRETLSWNKAPLRMLIGAPLMAPGLVLLGGGLEYLQSFILPMPDVFEKMFTDMIIPKDQPVWLTLLAVGVAPGICEETMFRGVILGLLRKKWPAMLSCVIVAVLFGLFHMSSYRLVPTALLGFILGVLVVRSKSIFPSMLLHAFNNGISVLIVALSLKVETSPGLIVAAVISTLIGSWLVFAPDKQGGSTTNTPAGD
jgi:membrane protease YdiL (CAAX protease family)